jgi:hypothetical protein
MSRLAAYLAGGLAIALAMDVLAPPVGAGFIRSGLMASPTSFSARFDAATASLYDVNRTGKGSRLAPAQPAQSATTITPKQNLTPGAQRPTSDIVREIDLQREKDIRREKAVPAEPLDGCDPAYSTLARVTVTSFTGRCLT